MTSALASANFDVAMEPRHRSWPYPRDRLQRLALAAGMGDDALRDLLHDAIQARLRERAPGPREDGFVGVRI